MSTTSLLVRKDNLSTTRLHTATDQPLAAGQVRVRIDSFALTSNNITYAAMGDAMSYWQFFPAEEEGWGSIPVWGFAIVVQSLHPGVAVGERLFGYWPLASSAVLSPDMLSPASLIDAAPHRAELHAFYNQYFRCNADLLYIPDTEDLQALLRPQFITSWLIDEFVADNDFFGASTMLLSSASSKTAYGTAFQLHQRSGLEVIGLTSPANVAFCESLGCYDRVVTYDALDSLAADTAGVYIDFAGNAGLRNTIHERFANLRSICAIGGTHVEKLAAKGAGMTPAGPRVTRFFVPTQIDSRTAEWGADEFSRRMVAAWRNFLATVTDVSNPWLVAEHHRGGAAVQAAYAKVLGGKGDPRTGHILALCEHADGL